MGLGDTWADAYLELQQREQSSVMFIIYKTNKSNNFCDVFESITNNQQKNAKF